MWQLKHVQKAHSSATKMKNRQRMAGELAALYEGGAHEDHLCGRARLA